MLYPSSRYPSNRYSTYDQRERDRRNRRNDRPTSLQKHIQTITSMVLCIVCMSFIVCLIFFSIISAFVQPQSSFNI